jgi:hypothetical protein
MQALQKLTRLGMRMLAGMTITRVDEKLEKLPEDLRALIRTVDEIIPRGRPPLA